MLGRNVKPDSSAQIRSVIHYSLSSARAQQKIPRLSKTNCRGKVHKIFVSRQISKTLGKMKMKMKMNEKLKSLDDRWKTVVSSKTTTNGMILLGK